MKNRNFYKACYLLIASIFTITAMDPSEIVGEAECKTTGAASSSTETTADAFNIVARMIGLTEGQKKCGEEYLSKLLTEEGISAFNKIKSICEFYSEDKRLGNIIAGIFENLLTIDEVLLWKDISSIPSNRHLAIINYTLLYKKYIPDIVLYFSTVPEALCAFDRLDKEREAAGYGEWWKLNYQRTIQEIFNPVINAIIGCEKKGRIFAEDVKQVRSLLPSCPMILPSQIAQLLRDIYRTESVDVARFMIDYAGFEPIFSGLCEGIYSTDLTKLMAICYNKGVDLDSLKVIINALPQKREEAEEYVEGGYSFTATYDNNYWREECINDFLVIAEREHFDKKIKAFALWSNFDRFACYEFRNIDDSCLTNTVIMGLHRFLRDPRIDKFLFINIFKKDNRKLFNDKFFARVEVSLPLFSLVKKEEFSISDGEPERLAAKISQAINVLSDDQIAILFPSDVMVKVRNLPIRSQIEIFERLAGLSPGYEDRVRVTLIKSVIDG